MGLSSLTKIDKFEKFAQIFYSASLLFARQWWVRDNFKDQKAANNDVVICLAGIMGILVSIITAVTYLIRSEVTTKRILVKADYVAAAGWGVCSVFTVLNQHLYKDDKFMINVGLQTTITALYLYQSNLFPRLWQSVTKASKSAAKKQPPPTRSKSPARESRSKSPAKSPARSKSPSKKK